MNHMKLRSLCEGAVLVAVAQILSYLKLWEMPWGGSVVLSMIPLVPPAERWCLGVGLLPSPSWVWPGWWPAARAACSPAL